MSGIGTRPTAGQIPVAANRQALADALLGIPSRIGRAFTNMAQQGLAANERFMQGEGANQPFLPSMDSGGRLGELASFITSNMAMGGPAGSLGAGMSTEGRASKAAAIASRAASAAPMDEAHSIAQMNAARPVSEGGLGLPANNTAGDRAWAMGFRDDVYHGSFSDLQKFTKASRGTATGSADARFATFTATDPKIANNYAHYQMHPNRYDMPKDVRDSGAVVYPLLAARRKHTTIDAAEFVDFDKQLAGKLRDAIKRGYNSALVEGPEPMVSGGDYLVMFDPRDIRSRFAAFDPAKRNSADLLASYGPNPLAAALYAQPQE